MISKFDPETPTALVLAGGLARGAFEAGALETLIGAGLNVSHIIGCSAGALNATGLAAAVRVGRPLDGARLITRVWEEEANLRAFTVDLRTLLRRRGVFSSAGVLRLLRRHVEPLVAGACELSPVRLDLVTTASAGVAGEIDGHPITTFEAVQTFDGRAFDSHAEREAIYRATAASAAVPVLFESVSIPGRGPCFDGGLMDDAPIRLAASAGAGRVVVLLPYPAADSFPGDPPLGLRLLMHLFEVVIHERLFRDLRDAARINRAIVELDTLVRHGELTATQAARVRHLFGWRAELEIIVIRPERALPGSAFAGFLDRRLRCEYIDAGRRAAAAALAKRYDQADADECASFALGAA